MVTSALAVIAAADLGVFAGRFYPYLQPNLAVPPTTPTIAFLQSQPKPFRIAPFFIYLWPNSSELYRLEDVRSHFSSEGRYRRLLHRIDPSSFSNHSTVITFNSLNFDFADPLISMLGVRYYLENTDIEIIKWTTFKYTIPLHKTIAISPGATIDRPLTVDAEPFYAIELPVTLERITAPNPGIVVSLLRGTSVLYSRSFTPAEIKILDRVAYLLDMFAGVRA